MKTFNQFLTEAENSMPLDLTEAVEWFSIFDEDLTEEEQIEVLEELSEQDLENLSWLKVYISEVIANKISPFTRSQAVKKLGTNKRVPFQRPTSQPAASAQGSTTTPQPAGGVNKRVPFQRPTSQPAASGSSTISPSQASTAGAPASTPGLRQSVKNLGTSVSSRVKGAAGSYVKNVRDPLASKINTPFVKAGQKITQTAAKVPGGSATLKGLGAVGKFASKAAVPVDVALNVANRKMSGQSWKRSIAGGAVETGGGLAGAAAGAALGTAILPGAGTVVGGVAGYMAGSGVAGKAFDTAAGATPQQKKAMATSNRQKQAGSGLVGTGGPTKVNTKKNTITTGGKTVALPKMQVNPSTGKAGYLAYKGGQATYKTAADPSTLAKTSSNPLERIGRSINPGAYAKQDTAAKASQLKKAQAGTASYKKSLGVK